MTKTRYLYGASVQGIQKFIFQTDKLKDIAGGSELVHCICTELFTSEFSRYGRSFDNSSAIINAAGNIRYVFDDEQLCRSMVRNFPKAVLNKAPGVTVSQAVVAFTMNDDFAKVSSTLEYRLKTQRNLPCRSTSIGLMGAERCRRTGLPAIACTDGEHLDAGTIAKSRALDQVSLCRKSFGIDTIRPSEIAFDISDMAGKDSWIAVVHADGNGLGQIVRRIGSDPAAYREFSRNLDIATTKSANEAFESVRMLFGDKSVIPIRPVVLGGDDMTVICRGDLAMAYTTQFLSSFEQNTIGIIPEGTFEDEPQKNFLTACAGIAYTKASFPFHYGYELAEQLCTDAKRDAKDSESIHLGKSLPMSCIAFHKIQDSFVMDYEDIVRRELTPNENLSFKYGPYYLHEKSGRWTIAELLNAVKNLADDSSRSAKTHIRRWISEQYNNPEKAEQMLNRSISVTEAKSLLKVATHSDERNTCPAYDILSVAGVIS